MKRLDQKQMLILAVVTIFIASVFLVAAIGRTLDMPETCARCHEMNKYVDTYLRPGNGSIISEHNLFCFGCHANSSQQMAKYAVLREIGISALNNLTGVSFEITSPELEINCNKCHAMKGYSHLNFSGIAICSECHWAHTPSLKGLNPYAIPSGPHRNQTCNGCHGKDFNIPRCLNCHKGHGEQKLNNSFCLACHTDPHVPIKPGILPENTVNFSKDMPYFLCTPCHEKQYEELNVSHSMHFEMQTCTLCHESHGKKPGCSKCHPDRIFHGHTTLWCYDCHGKINRLSCKLCHGESHEWNAFTAFRPEELN